VGRKANNFSGMRRIERLIEAFGLGRKLEISLEA